MKIIRSLILILLVTHLGVQAKESFDSLTKSAQQHQGFFTFYYDQSKGRVLLELSKSEQDFLFQSSLPNGVGSNDIGLDRGQLGDTRLVRFERIGNKVLLKQLNSYYRANSANFLEQQAVEQAFASSVIWGFKVLAESKDKTKWLIDYTPFLLSDIHQVSAKLKRTKQGSFKVDASRSAVYPKRSKAFPDNTELEATITFTGKGDGQFIKSVAPDANIVTVNMHHSLVRLPDEQYQARKFQPFSGYWAIDYMDYASPIEQDIVKRVIPRHRLVKKDPNAAMSEAVEPIIYYLDAGVPDPVRSALLDGARWWNQAFEAIGYKNAFQVKMLPADADPMDIRYNVIQWVHRATRGWSYGASVVDPRTGEIIKGHVTLGSLRVRQDYLIALGLTSPFKGKNVDTSKQKAMALARIRQLSAHEVGHTLGIAHNFAASANNRASVMDYPYPQIEIKNGKIDLSNAYAKDIGIWDKYVIAYGYSDFPAGTNEQQALDTLVEKAQQAGLDYLSDADARPKSGADPTAHLWDNGSDAVNELNRVLKVRQLALAKMGLNSIPEGAPLSEIEQVLVPIYNFHRYQVEAVAKLVAGVDYGYEIKSGNTAKGVKALNDKAQQQAVDALLNTLSPKLLTLPQSLLDLMPPKAMGYPRNRESFVSNTGLTFDPVSAAQASANHTLNLLLNAQRLARLAQQSMQDSKVLSVDDLFTQLLKESVKQKPQQGLSALIQQRINQQIVDQLIKLWQQDNVMPEVKASAFAQLEQLNKWLGKNSDSRKYRAFEQHFNWLANHIELSFKQGKLVQPVKAVKLPPGSPIGG